MSYACTYKLLTIGHKTWKIIYKNGVYHWKGSKNHCRWCGKLEFQNKEVADFYALYLKIKYNKRQRSYYDYDCGTWHLTSNLHAWW